MHDLAKLGDEELAALAAQWRARALHGEHEANGRAHELEREIRRRAHALSTFGAKSQEPTKRRHPWWAFWWR